MSDVTNPGLVNVADQAFDPALKTDSLAIPLDDDVLTSVAGEAEPAVTDNPLATTFPTPANVVVGGQSPGQPPPSPGQIPGRPPLYPPSPPSPTDPNIQGQSVTAGTIAEFTVGPDMSIQTNLTPAVIEDYAVTAVLDADTLAPPTTPNPATSGTFAHARSGGTGIVTLISSTPIPAALVDGEAAQVAGTPNTYDGTFPVSNVVSNLSGSFAAAAPSIVSGTTLASSSPLPAGIANAKWGTFSASSVAAYNGIHSIGNVISLSGTVTAVVQENGSLTKSTVVTSAPTGLSNGQLLGISGTGGLPPAGYDGYWTVSNVINLAGSISSIVNSTPGTSATVNLLGTVPAGLVAGQSIMISGTTHYNGAATVLSATTGNTSFVIVWTNAATPNDGTGAWTAYTFDIGTPYTVSFSGTAAWFAYTFDIDAIPGLTATGNWTSYTFDIPGTYSGDASGAWTYTPSQPTPTTRYILYVTPTDLASFGISMLGRQIVFDAASTNPGASRLVTGYGSNWIAINQVDPADMFTPTLATPVPGDTFTLSTQRQGSEVITSGTGIVEDVTLLPSPAPAPSPVASTPDVFPQGQGTVSATTGPQPGRTIVTSGVPAPTAINVDVASQPPIGTGLPANVFP